MRNYQCDTTFTADEPFMYPATKTFRAVEADKTAFPLPNTEPQSPLSKTAKKTKKNAEGEEEPAGGDDAEEGKVQVTKSYNDMFKLKNM